MPTKLLTFHRILAGCEEGNREAWRAFLENYTPLVYQVCDIHLGFSEGEREEFWRQVLTKLAWENFERLRKLEHQGEKEFLSGLREFILEEGAKRLDPSHDSTDAPRPTPEIVSGLLKGLPLAHQEVLFFKLAGYSDSTIEKILVITPSVAQKGLERLQAEYSTLVARTEEGCLWPAAWAEVARTARESKEDGCPALRQFIRVQEGGFQWHEKEPVEGHVSGCLSCLERWTALREVWHWRGKAKPRSPAEIESLLVALPTRSEGRARLSFLERIFK